MIQESVINIIADMAKIDAGDISLEDSLLMLGIDSLVTVELIITIEETLGIIFDDSALDPEALTTVGSVIDMVVRYQR